MPLPPFAATKSTHCLSHTRRGLRGSLLVPSTSPDRSGREGAARREVGGRRAPFAGPEVTMLLSRILTELPLVLSVVALFLLAALL